MHLLESTRRRDWRFRLAVLLASTVWTRGVLSGGPATEGKELPGHWMQSSRIAPSLPPPPPSSTDNEAFLDVPVHAGSYVTESTRSSRSTYLATESWSRKAVLGSPKTLKPNKADGSGPIVVADLSSNILSRDTYSCMHNFGAIFFGAPKHLGFAGITGVIIKKSLIPQPSATLMRTLGSPLPPVVLQYEMIAKNNGLYTLSYVPRIPTRTDGQEAVSKKKAELIYALDAFSEICTRLCLTSLSVTLEGGEKLAKFLETFAKG
ncbi:hypothetical protein EsDP_00003494 [Epichloe bromicola]|uniref:Uncharacterized protein n=1 Tax=Epichloe bromicola TaxID=79588 RepID=A0ABQ0CNY1_9HYPO